MFTRWAAGSPTALPARTPPMGYIIAEANRTEQILYAACDFTKVKRLQELWGFFAARRPQEYERLCDPC